MSCSVAQMVHDEHIEIVRNRVKRRTRAELSVTPNVKQTVYKFPDGVIIRVNPEPEPLETISEDEDEDKEYDENGDEIQYEIIIDEMKTTLLAPRFDFIMSETKAYAQIKRMAPKQMKRKVIILGAPSVGMFFLRVTPFASDKANIVGKTSLTRQYIQPPTYVEGYFPTIEQTERKHIMYDGIDYDCEIIDTAGQVRLLPSLNPFTFFHPHSLDMTPLSRLTPQATLSLSVHQHD